MLVHSFCWLCLSRVIARAHRYSCCVSRGLPGWLAMLLVIALIIGIGALLAWLVGGAVNDFSSNLPKYQASLAQQTSGFSAWLTAQGVQVDPATFSTYLDPGKAMGMAAKLLSALGGVLTPGCVHPDHSDLYLGGGRRFSREAPQCAAAARVGP